MDPYFNRPEISNSDLSELDKYFKCRAQVGDIEAAYRFGTLVDAIITEPEKLDFFKRTIDEYTYSEAEIQQAAQMKRAYLKDEICRKLHSYSTFQKVFSGPVDLEHRGFQFQLLMRCKFDMWMQPLAHGGDIKSTAATTQKQFEEAIRYFDYDRQRAVYMNLSGAKKDILIGISKKNFKVFKVYINRESDLYRSGMEKLEEIGFKWWCLFDGLKLSA